MVRRIIALLNRVDIDLAEQVARAMERLPASAFTVARLDAVLKDVRNLNAEAYRQVRGELEKDLRDLAGYEVGYQSQLFESLGIEFTTRGVTAGQVYVGAMAQPFQGRLLREWMAGLESGAPAESAMPCAWAMWRDRPFSRWCSACAALGRRAMRDGLLEIDRRNAEAVVRTAISHTAGLAEIAGTRPTTTSSARWSGSVRWTRAPARCAGCAMACSTRLITNRSATESLGALALASYIGVAAAAQCRS